MNGEHSFCTQNVMSACFVSAPAIFPIAYALCKPFLSEDTKSKLRVLGSEFVYFQLRICAQFQHSDVTPPLAV